jgi:hypothetical protein
MPRSRRPDLTPEILLPDVRQQERQANEAIGNQHRAKVRPVDYRPISDGWTTIFDRTHEHLDFVRRNGVRIDHGLVFLMMRRLAKAQSSPVMDNAGEPLVRERCIVHTLRRVGCRVYKTQNELATMYGCSRQKVNAQIKMMRKHGLIVNQGNGWYEFDANLCWRGDFRIQKAYREQQRVRDGWVITDGKTTLVTEDMDDDDIGGDGEHPSPALRGIGEREFDG